MLALYFFLIVSFGASLINSIKNYKNDNTKKNLIFIAVNVLGVLLSAFFFLDNYL